MLSGLERNQYAAMSNSELTGTITANDEDDLSVARVGYRMVPIEHRDQYMMQFKSRLGGDELKRISNSDIIHLEHYLYRTRDFVYTQQVQECLFREKR